jgi:hypothetical protein
MQAIVHQPKPSNVLEKRFDYFALVPARSSLGIPTDWNFAIGARGNRYSATL